MNKATLLTLVVLIECSFGVLGASNVRLLVTELKPQIELDLDIKNIDVDEFMRKVVLTYQMNKRKTAHIATAVFEEYGKVDGRYAQYTISSGHAIYKGDEVNVAKMALYSFVPEKTNKSWRRAEWLASSKYNKKKRTDLPMNGGVGLNSYQYFELVGPLSDYTERYNYQLKDVYWVGNERVYRIRFSTKATFGLTGRFTKGYIIVSANDKKLISADVSGELLWSSMFHERVFGTMHYEYVYYEDQPFISSISTRYQKKKIEERTLLKINIQKLNSFVVEPQAALDIQLLEKNPDVVADKNLFRHSSMGIDFKELIEDLGFEEDLWSQFQSSSGLTFWRYSDPNRSILTKNRENAVLLVEEYKKIFSSL